jgi:tRNA(Ile)-lysidine synthase TilS/MesJ
MSIVMTRGMRKKLDEALQESVRNGRPIFELDLSKVDNKIVTAFHRNDALETTTKKIESNTGTIQLLEFMGEPFLRLMPIMLQQKVF